MSVRMSIGKDLSSRVIRAKVTKYILNNGDFVGKGNFLIY